MKPSSRQHPTDEQLIDAYFARAGNRSDNDAVAAASEHVGTCEACTRRAAELTASLEDLRQDAIAEADAYFTPDRLAAQHERVMRRLEGAEHPARVIPFPQLPVRMRPAGARHLYRWVAAAAAAGLLLGVAAGRLLYQQGNQTSSSASVSAAPPAVQMRTTQPDSGGPAGTRDLPAENPSRDEAFLKELEDALTQQRIAELQALDALTPHVREAAARPK